MRADTFEQDEKQNRRRKETKNDQHCYTDWVRVSEELTQSTGIFRSSAIPLYNVHRYDVRNSR